MSTPIFSQFPFDCAEGDPFRAFSRVYYLDRVDEDSVVTLRSGHKSGTGDFLVTDEDGLPRKPSVDELLALISTGDVARMERLPQNAEARARRQAEIDADQARQLDEICDFRMHLTRVVEQRREKGMQSLSDEALKAPVNAVWRLFKRKRKELKQAKRDGTVGVAGGSEWKRPKRKPCGTTVRTWYHTRGNIGSRKTSDGVSRTGRSVRARKIDHPIEILAYHACRALANRTLTSQALRDYRAELTLIHRGKAFPRPLAEVDDDGNWRIGDKPAEYPPSERPYAPVSQSVFYDLVRAMRSKKAYAIQTSARGAMQRYEGGGRTDMPSRIGQLGQMDDTPVPNLFLMCEVTNLPLGSATATFVIDVCSRLIAGCDLSWESANTNTVLRTILDANRPKVIPERLLEFIPEEGAALARYAASWAMRFDTIRGDNLTAYHGTEVEDACMDVGTVTEFTGKHKPRGKPHVERVIGTLQQLLFNRLPEASWDITLARRFGYDPDKHVMCTLQQARERLQLAVFIYNCTRHSGLDGKQPALVRKEHNERYLVNDIKDEARLKRAMMRSEKNAEFGNDGLSAFGRRYSEAVATATIYQDHEKALRNKAAHLGPKQKKRHKVGHKESPTYTVRYRYDEDNLGSVFVWNPHCLPEGDWIEVPCTDPEMKGRPKALHDRRFELFGEAADEFLDLTTEDLLHAYLSNEISNVTEASSEREKVRHAIVMDTPAVRSAMRNYVTIANEGDLDPAEQHRIESGARHGSPRSPEGSGFVPATARANLAAPRRKDGHTHTPRPAPHGRRPKPTPSTPSKRANQGAAQPSEADQGNRRQRRRSGSLSWDDVA